MLSQWMGVARCSGGESARWRLHHMLAGQGLGCNYLLPSLSEGVHPLRGDSEACGSGHLTDSRQ